MFKQTEYHMTKTYREYMQDIENGIPLPDYIPSGGESSCDICGHGVTWPRTGEPAEGCCDWRCDDKLRTEWRRRTDPRYWDDVSMITKEELQKALERVSQLKITLAASNEMATKLRNKLS